MRKFNLCYPVTFAGRYGPKTRWVPVGKGYETARGVKLHLDAIPVGFNGELMMFEDVGRGAQVQIDPVHQTKSPVAESAPVTDYDEEIPF